MIIARRHRWSLLLVVFLFWAAPVAAEQEPLPASAVSEVFVDIAQAQNLIDQGATIIDARERSEYRRAYIPNSVSLPWQAFVSGSQSGEVISDDAHLESLVQGAGISSDRPVVIYGNWSDEDAWGEEGRIYWSLDYLGHRKLYILQGGLEAWTESGRNTAHWNIFSRSEPSRGNFEIRRTEDIRITTEELQEQLSEESLVLIDTRQREEYEGEIKYGESRPGHIDGAIHIWWKSLFDDQGHLRPAQEIQEELRARGIEEDSQIVVYCTGGIRSGFFYAMLRSLGYANVQNYDASMWDWTSDPDAPLSNPTD